MLMKACR